MACLPNFEHRRHMFLRDDLLDVGLFALYVGLGRSEVPFGTIFPSCLTMEITSQYLEIISLSPYRAL